jgi:serine/threonine-protein kinase
VNESPVLPSIANPEVTPLLDAVLMRALAKNPANRYQTADEFRADLERARLGQDVLATPLMPPGEDATQVISRRRRRRCCRRRSRRREAVARSGSEC